MSEEFDGRVLNINGVEIDLPHSVFKRLKRLHLLERDQASGKRRICGRVFGLMELWSGPDFRPDRTSRIHTRGSSRRWALPTRSILALARLQYDRDAGVATYNPRAPSRSHLLSPARERFSPLDALAALTASIPEKGQQIVRYYGRYSNKARGKRRRQSEAAAVPGAASCRDAARDDDFRRLRRRAWARLIRKVYLTDPMTCPKCRGRLRLLSFIDNPCVMEKILRHLKLWDPPERPPPPRRCTTMEPDTDFLDWATMARQFDGID